MGNSGNRAWRTLTELAGLIHTRQACMSAELGLTMPQGHLLCLLEPGKPVAIGRLAEPLGCDASNVTGIVDRLEALGLIERSSAKKDRRIRMIALTERGVAVRDQLTAYIYTAPSPLDSLTDNEIETLDRILVELWRELRRSHR